MDIIFNKEGTPLLATAKTAFVSTSGSAKIFEPAENEFTYHKTSYVAWGGNNRRPDDADEVIRSTGVLSTALNYKCRVCYGQGVVPATPSGFDDKMNELFQPIDNPDVMHYLNGYGFRRYHTEAFRDLVKFGNCFPVFSFNTDYSKILAVYTINARHCRISTDKTKLITYGGFSEGTNPDDTAVVYFLLDENDPFTHLAWLKKHNKLKNTRIAFPRIKNYFSNNDYYATPDWETAWNAGWIDVAHQIPVFLKAAYKNAMQIMWHIKIPYAYWQKKFPKENFENAADRQQAINSYMQQIEDCLVGEENAQKALFTQFSLNESGKAEEKWEIERLQNDIKAEERLSTSAAANSEILFSLMVNPSVLGAGMPGGPYAGNAGSGSDIREGLLTSMILSHIERNQVLDPVEMMLQYNGYSNIDLKYKNILLTTLDTGKSSTEKIS